MLFQPAKPESRKIVWIQKKKDRKKTLKTDKIHYLLNRKNYNNRIDMLGKKSKKIFSRSSIQWEKLLYFDRESD